MTKVRLAVAFSTGVPLSKTRKLMLMSVPAGWLVLMAQFVRPIRLNVCPACTGDTTRVVQMIKMATVSDRSLQQHATLHT